MLDKDLLAQLTQIFAMLTNPVKFHLFLQPSSPKAQEMENFIADVCSTSPLLSYEVKSTEHIANEFSIFTNGSPTRITFRGIPGGHEFNSLLLAILNADGKGKNLPDSTTLAAIRSLRGPIALTTYVSLTCTNCPDVVQALNIFAITNPGITHTIVDGAANQAEADARGIQAVPAVYASDKLISVGRTTLADLLETLRNQFGTDTAATDTATAPTHRNVDILIFGGGPAGVSSAIYAARKGLTTAIVAKDGGGSVSLTGDIDNLITTRTTTGDRLATELKGNATAYAALLFENRTVTNVDPTTRTLTCSNGETFTGRALIIATGATPRHLNVPGETDYTGRGVAFCPHCDGPYFRNKRVVVVGGGNAGIEAAIDLAALCTHVTVVEFLPEMKADQVLIDHMHTLPNVEAHTNRQVISINGDGTRVTSVTIRNRADNTDLTLPTDGIFIQIGTVPNTTILRDKLPLNHRGEIETDRNCRTSLPFVYAAGDAATSPFKQIVVALGEGATATLSAFEDLIRH